MIPAQQKLPALHIRFMQQCLYFEQWPQTTYSISLLEEPTAAQLVNKFPEFYGTHMFIIVFTKAHYLFIYLFPDPDQYNLRPTNPLLTLIFDIILPLKLFSW